MHNSYVPKHLRYFNLLIKVFAILSLADSAASIRCYICGPEENPSDCDNFNRSNENLYAKECPPDSQGCSSSRTKESITSLACENQKLNDCQFANAVEYCYCSFDLCNGNESIKKPITISSIGLNDDEDLIEGSGYNQIFPSTGSTIPTLHAAVQPPNTGDCLRSTFIIIAASVLLP